MIFLKKHEEIALGKSELIKDGSDITIIAIGKMVEKAIEVADELSNNNINAEVINARFLKPIDDEMMIKSINKTKRVITIEDGLLRSGLATTINELIIKNNLDNIKIKNLGYDDTYVKQGSVDEIEELYGLNSKSIVKECLELDKNPEEFILQK